MISDKRKTLYLIIGILFCIIILVILMVKNGSDNAPSSESEVQDSVTLQDEPAVTDKQLRGEIISI